MHWHGFTHHFPGPIFLGLFWLWVSGSMITHMWFEHWRDPFFKKLGWTFVLCVPFFGWLFYCGMYTPLESNEVRCAGNRDAMAGPGA
jgi:hypothetical protein